MHLIGRFSSELVLLLVANPSKSDQAIAAIVGVARSSVQSYRSQLAKSGKLKPVLTTIGVDGKKRLVSSKKRKAARLFVKSKGEYDKLAGPFEECGSVKGFIRNPDQLRKKVAQQRAAKAIAEAGEITLPSSIRIDHCDFRKLKIKNGSVDLICTDVLWHEQCSKDWNELAALSHRWLKPNGVFVSFIGQMVLWEFLSAVGAHLNYQSIQAFAFDQTVRNIGRQVMECWRPIIVFSKSSKRMRFGFCKDLLRGGGAEKLYLQYQQPLCVVTELVETLSKKGDLVVDPCLGSGTTAVACRDLGRKFVGCDIDAEAVKTARYRVAEDGKKAG